MRQRPRRWLLRLWRLSEPLFKATAEQLWDLSDATTVRLVAFGPALVLFALAYDLVVLTVFLSPWIVLATLATLLAFQLGCATTVTVGPSCAITAEIATGTKIRCVEIERASIAESIEETGKAAGGLLRGLLGVP